ncbi:hypothetical protein V5799_010402 [Amblyomma americanum]|uniref:Uncharacterized protein n=1 Tax=Amblyomma americanum TaxID=6943 RepID=A0AAQ4EJS9_AMBAM
MSSSAQAVDQATLDSIARNRNRLLRLADNIKVRKKPGSKRAVDLRLDPGYTNIEHLVFGTYRPRTSLPGSSQLPAAGPDQPQQPPLQQPPAPAQPAAHSSREATAALLSTPPPTRCECSAHSPRRRVPPCGGSEQQGEVAGVSDDAGGRACPADQRASRTERPPPAPAAGHAWPSGSSTHDATVVTAALACDEPAAAHARGDMSRVAASCFDAGGVAGRRSSKRVARSGSLQTRTTTTQGRQEFEKTSSYAPGLGGEEARIIQVDLHAASRPKVREPAVVYSLQPAVDFAGHELRVPVPRKDVRPADVLPLSPWRGVQPKPQPISDHSVDALLLADTCISPPGMFKDRDITDQSSYKPPPLTESTLSRWVGNTSRESARLLNELAVFAESKLPCRLNEPQSRSGLAIGAAETWFDSLRKDTCEEPTALQSPVRESTSHLLPSASGAASSSRTASRSDCPTGSPSISRASNGKVLVTMRSHSVEDAADDVADDVRASPRVRKTSSVEVPGVARDPSAAPSGSPAPYRSPKLVNGSGLTASPAHSQHQQQYVHHGSPQLQREHRPPPPPPPPPPLQPVGFSPTRSPYRKKSTGQQPVAMPPKVWMSDIEERDENSSSSAASKVAADLRGDPDCTLLHSSSSSSASSSSTISESNGVSVVVRVSSWDQRSSSAPTLSTIGPLSPGRPPLSFESHSFAVNGGVTNGYWMPKTFAQCNGASGCEPLPHPKRQFSAFAPIKITSEVDRRRRRQNCSLRVRVAIPGAEFPRQRLRGETAP